MAFLCPLGKLSLELTLFLPLHGFLGPAWVLRGNPRAAGLSLLSLTQGQLELLRRLFTEALYEEALSQVSGKVGPVASQSLQPSGSNQGSVSAWDR